jgi:two-component system, OmpR family, alkaline phosphatase synthesis response regulator PhoP
MMHVLVIEDDASLRLSIQIALRSGGYRVTTAKDGRSGLDAIAQERPDLVLLDVMMPGMNGFEVLSLLRESDAELPVLMLTARSTEADRIAGLNSGADDYIVKPFAVGELLARVGAALRRLRVLRKQNAVIEFGAIRLDFDELRAFRDGAPVELTALEFKLLRFFVENEGRALTRSRIVDVVWGADYFGTERTVDNFVTRLRQKLEADGGASHFVTVRGTGYRFVRAVTKP